MASVRKLKKDINYLAYELLTEVFAYRHFHPDLKEKEFDKIIQEVVLKRNELISRVNRFDKLVDEKNLPQHFKAIREEMTELLKVLDKFATK
jgi:hypothetical protein